MSDEKVKVEVVRQFISSIGPAGESVTIKVTPKGQTMNLPKWVVADVKEVIPPVIKLVK